VTLTASAQPPSVFAGWTGACSDAGTCQPTLSGDANVGAIFNTIPSYVLQVIANGSGTVTSDPSGINCPGTCGASFQSGTVVTLIPQPNPDWAFVGWEGDPRCRPFHADPCSLTLNVNDTVGADFTANRLYVTTTGSGTVTSNPPGVSCPGPSCMADFRYGTQVSLNATAGPGWMFAGWTGACSGAGACQATVNGPISVGATFSQIPAYSLAVSTSGSGSVTSDPVGVSCGADASCSGMFNTGTQVSLTAAANAGWTFSGWSGACSGIQPCQLTVNGPASVSATFTQIPSYVLITSVAGNGTVTSAPSGISCGAACSASFPSGTRLTLSPAPAAGASFAGWSGACSGVGTCQVTLTGNTTVAATFTQPLTSGTGCSGYFAGTFSGDVTVSAGQTCTFLCPGEIKGNVTVNSGTFTLGCKLDGNLTENAGGITLLAMAKVGGNLQISGLSSFAVNPGATIGGNLQIQHVATGVASATVCGTQVNGNLQVQNNNSPITIGSNKPTTCPATRSAATCKPTTTAPSCRSTTTIPLSAICRLRTTPAGSMFPPTMSTRACNAPATPPP
jgi:hypothetical protein